MQRQVVLGAVVTEAFDRRADESDAAVIAVQSHIICEFVDRAEPALVILGPNDLDVRPFVQVVPAAKL